MKLLTVEEAAQRLGVGVRFVRRLVAERRIRIHKIGKHVRIAESDLDAFIAAGRIDPTEKGLKSGPDSDETHRSRPEEHREDDEDGDWTAEAS